MADPDDRLSDFRALLRAVTEAPGKLDPSVRKAAMEGGSVPAGLSGFVEKTRSHAWKITPEEVAALGAAGFSDDQVFEVAVAAALGAGNVRLEAALKALEAGK